MSLFQQGSVAFWHSVKSSLKRALRTHSCHIVITFESIFRPRCLWLRLPWLLDGCSPPRHTPATREEVSASSPSPLQNKTHRRLQVLSFGPLSLTSRPAHVPLLKAQKLRDHFVLLIWTRDAAAMVSFASKASPGASVSLTDCFPQREPGRS